ncbi:maleylpyruvate isomerase family mycothiol-dependent enzyme [Pseudonocardia xishanensis]|uniref:Mycothiol-dependent maleylpyruvate isomerase metal-binding domain-containing protein n=1 Tax=Pseudonocardia xishanensis TaxID=630995 RepID=A0ABP8RXW1_9PSEU
MTTTAPSRPSVRRSTLDHATAARLAATEYDRYLDLLRSLDPADWSRPTECPGWDVRAMAAHNLGMAENGASVVRMMREHLASLREMRRDGGGGSATDRMTARQVADRAGMTAADIVARFAEVAPRAAEGRRRRPAPMRAVPIGAITLEGGASEPWSLGYLLDTILTRDLWMHRMDTCRAVGREPVLTPDHDGVLVADVVAEWAGRHGAPCTLVLSGPAGGRWEIGQSGPLLELDASEFCRAVSLRERGTGLLATEVPF